MASCVCIIELEAIRSERPSISLKMKPREISKEIVNSQISALPETCLTVCHLYFRVK